MEAVIVVIIIVLLIVVLAVLGDSLEFESGTTQGFIPSFKLKFKKDAKLLGFLLRQKVQG